MLGTLTFWVIIGLVALIIDLLTSTFIFIWFTVGSIGAIIMKFLGFDDAVQTLTFIIVSIVFLAIGYPIAKKTIKKTVSKTLTREEGYIGLEISTEDDILDKGKVKIDGAFWTVKNESESIIKKGEKIKIIGIQGNKLLIRKI